VSTADEDYALGLYPDGSGALRNRFGLRDAALTPMAVRLAEYQARKDAEAAAAKVTASPAVAPDPTPPAPARPKPGRDPSPGF